MQQVRQKLAAKKRTKNGGGAGAAADEEGGEEGATAAAEEEAAMNNINAEANKKFRKWYFRVATSAAAAAESKNGGDRRSCAGGGSKHQRRDEVNSRNNNSRPSSSRKYREEFLLPSTMKDFVSKIHSNRKASGMGSEEEISNVIYLEKRRNSTTLPKLNVSGGGLENKVFIEQQQTIPLNGSLGAKSKSTGYELPKLLIREDSPIEAGGSSSGGTVPDSYSNCSLETAVSYCSNSNLTSDNGQESEGNKNESVQEPSGDCEKELEPGKFITGHHRRRNRQFEDRLLTQFYDNSSTQYENFFQAFSTSSDIDIKSSGGRNNNEAESSSNSMKFKWKFGENEVENNSDYFLNSLLMKRNRSSKIQKFTKSNLEINKNTKPASMLSTSSLLLSRGDEGNCGSGGKKNKDNKLSFGKTISVDCITNNIENEKQQEKLKKAGNKMDLNNLNNLTFGSSPTLMDSSSQSSLLLLKSEDFYDDDEADVDVVAELLEDDFDHHEDSYRNRTSRFHESNDFSRMGEAASTSSSYSGRRYESGNYAQFYNHSGEDENADRTSIIRVKNNVSHCGRRYKSEFCCPAVNRLELCSSGGEDDEDGEEEHQHHHKELDCADESFDFDDFSCSNLSYSNLNRSFRSSNSRSFLPKLVTGNSPSTGDESRFRHHHMPTTSANNTVNMANRDGSSPFDFDDDIVEIDTSDLLGGMGKKDEDGEDDLDLEDVEGDLQKIIEKVTSNFLDEEQDEEPKRDISSMSLPEISSSASVHQLLETDLKMMGLDSILNDDDSFERSIRQHQDDFDERPIQAIVEEVKKKTKSRCAQCNKKLGIIMIMQCHCGKLFCAQHRYAEAHNCSYDFKEEGKKILAKDNPLVVADKLPRI